jgi:AcrR family transcriptional regulator
MSPAMARPTRSPPVRRSASHRPLSRSPARTAARAPLTRDRIVAAAQALVERDGLDRFSVRGLGEALGCEPMSLYHYFPSKAHLQDALVDDALSEVEVQIPGPDPVAGLRAAAHSWRAMARRHPRLFPLIAVHRLNTEAGVRFIDAILALVRAAVADEGLAARHFRVLGYYLTGAALDETSGYARGPSAAVPASDAFVAEHCPNLVAVAPYFAAEWWDSTFDLGLETLLDAMRAAAPSTLPAVAVAPKPVIHPKR